MSDIIKYRYNLKPRSCENVVDLHTILRIYITESHLFTYAYEQ